jgi:hypothetical protein
VNRASAEHEEIFKTTEATSRTFFTPHAPRVSRRAHREETLIEA